MPRTPVKVDHVTNVLRRRIRRGDYLHRPLPTEPDLAEQTGVSRMTARKAIVRLVESGLLFRQPHGKVVVKPTTNRLQIALLKPSYEGSGPDWWINGAHRASEQFDGQEVAIRPVDYVHWDDPVLMNVVESGGAERGQGGRYDGILLLPAAEMVPDSVVSRLQRSTCPVVVLGRELVSSGLPSVDRCPPQEFTRLFEHLRVLGHRRIDLINTQPHTTGLTIRFEIWERWCAEANVAGRKFDYPTKSYGNTMIAGYDQARKLIERGQLGSAVFCTTTATALGVMRAAHEMGLRIGTDLSICGADDEGFAKFTVPSITTLIPPDPEPLLQQVLTWIADGGNQKVGRACTAPQIECWWVAGSPCIRANQPEAHLRPASHTEHSPPSSQSIHWDRIWPQSNSPKGTGDDKSTIQTVPHNHLHSSRVLCQLCISWYGVGGPYLNRR